MEFFSGMSALNLTIGLQTKLKKKKLLKYS